MNQYFWEDLRKKEQVEEELNNIPEAMLYTIKQETREGFSEIKNPDKINVVVVNGEIVGTVSRHYKLIQHKDAFKPILNGLQNLGSDYGYSLLLTKTRAYMNVFVDEGYDSVSFGFRAQNAIDGGSSVRYAFSSFMKERVIELVGYRKVCSNGMIIRVPLDNAQIVRLEEREKIEQLLMENTKIIHMGNAEEKVQAVQYVVEAMTLLKNPLERLIKTAQSRELTEEAAKEFIRKYVGKRVRQKILDRYEREEPTLWGVYNAITNVASNENLSVRTSNGLINRAAMLMEKEV